MTYQGDVQLHALGDASRRAIVATLSESGPMPVARLAERLPISRPAVSQHLRVLKDAGLVRDTANGTRRIYGLDTAGLADLRAWFTRYWQADLAGFAGFVAQTLDQEQQP